MTARALAARRLAWLVASGLLVVPAASAQTAEELIDTGHVVIRSRLEPEEILVGQRVTLSVEVLTKTWFPQAPRFPDTIEGRDAISLPAARGPNVSDRVGGQSLNGVSRRYDLYPVAPGTFMTPPVAVTVVTALEGAKRSRELVLRAPSQRYTVRLPVEARGLGLVLAAPSLEVKESYEPDSTSLEVGDALSRKVSFTVRDSVAMLIPPVEFTAPEGVAVYPGRPEVADEGDRGERTGRRLDSATYVMEEEGSYLLSEQTIHWWNTRAGRLETIVLPARELSVAPNPELAVVPEEQEVEVAAGPATAPDETGGRKLLVGLAAAALLVIILWRYGRGWRQALAERRRRAAEGEAAWFLRFRAAAKRGDPREALVGLMAWLDRVWPGPQAATLQGLVSRYGDESLRRESQELLQRLYSSAGRGAEGWSGESLAGSAERARLRLLRPEERDAGPRLVVLNPG